MNWICRRWFILFCAIRLVLNLSDHPDGLSPGQFAPNFGLQIFQNAPIDSVIRLSILFSGCPLFSFLPAFPGFVDFSRELGLHIMYPKNDNLIFLICALKTLNWFVLRSMTFQMFLKCSQVMGYKHCKLIQILAIWQTCHWLHILFISHFSQGSKDPQWQKCFT